MRASLPPPFSLSRAIGRQWLWKRISFSFIFSFFSLVPCYPQKMQMPLWFLFLYKLYSLLFSGLRRGFDNSAIVRLPVVAKICLDRCRIIASCSCIASVKWPAVGCGLNHFCIVKWTWDSNPPANQCSGPFLSWFTSKSSVKSSIGQPFSFWPLSLSLCSVCLSVGLSQSQTKVPGHSVIH